MKRPAPASNRRDGRGERVSRGPDERMERMRTAKASPETGHGFIPPHGGYQDLLAYQKAVVVFDATAHFCDRFIAK